MSLGLTATGPRNILPGKEFDKFFTQAAYYSNPVISRNGSVEDAVAVMAQTAEKYKKDTALIAPLFKGATVEETTHNIWNFIYSYIQYKEDDPGIEQIRRPLRTWLDRTEGVDCDCMSVFASSILKNLNIPHYFRITKYGKPDFQHVYVIVPKQGESLSGGRDYYTIDGVIDGYNKEKTFTDHKDFNTMNGIPIHVLNGLQGTVTQDQTVYDYLVRSRTAIEQNPQLIAEKICPCDAVPMFTHIIENWSDPHSRAEAIKKAAEFEQQNFSSLNFFQRLWQYMEGTATPAQVMSASYIDGFAGLGLLPDGTAGPELPDGWTPPADTGDTGSSGNWWSNWGSGVSSFMADLLKTGVAYDIAKNVKPPVTTTPGTTTNYPPGTIPPPTATQAGMSTGTIVLTLGVLLAAGVAAYSFSGKKASPQPRIKRK